MSLYKDETPSYLKEAIESCLNQTVLPDEIVLVCDGPLKHDLNHVLLEYEKNAIVKIIRLTLNHGLGYALNVGLDNCRNEIIARMDTDDVNKLDRIEKQLERLRLDPCIDVLGSCAEVINEEGVVVGEKKVPVSHDVIKKGIWANPIIHPSVLYKKSKIIKIYGYDQKLKRRQDYDLWFRCIEAGYIFGNMPEPLIMYRKTTLSYGKNSTKNSLNQFLIGVKGVRRTRGPYRAYIALFYPLLKSMFPVKLQAIIDKFGARFDPRRKKN